MIKKSLNKRNDNNEEKMFNENKLKVMKNFKVNSQAK